MRRALEIMAGGCLLALAGGAFVIELQISQLAKHADAAIVAADGKVEAGLESASETLDSLNATLANVNRPCKGPPGPDACGTLAQINKVAIDAGDMTVQTQLEVRQMGTLIQAATSNLNDAGADVSVAAHAIEGTANQATATLEQGREAIAAAQPLLADTDTTVKQLGSVAPSANALLATTDDSMKHADGILAAGETVAKRYAYPAPKRWYQKVWDVSKTAGELTWDFMR